MTAGSSSTDGRQGMQQSSLRGDLTVLTVPSLLQVLAAEQRTGRLQLSETGGAELGALWVEDGRVVHAQAAGSDDAGGDDAGDATEVAHGLVMTSEGLFAFEPGEAPPSRTIEVTTDQLVVEAACRVDHSRRKPALDASAVPALAPVPEGGATPRFNTLQWRVLAAIDGKTDVARLAAGVDMPVHVVAAVLGELLEAGVLSVVEP